MVPQLRLGEIRQKSELLSKGLREKSFERENGKRKKVNATHTIQ
jgi:hypothetical protein